MAYSDISISGGIVNETSEESESTDDDRREVGTKNGADQQSAFQKTLNGHEKVMREKDSFLRTNFYPS